MKYARLTLKWILPIGLAIIFLNGAYIGFKGIQLTPVEVEVKSKSEDANKYGAPIYYLSACPTTNKEIECRDTRVSKAIYDEVIIGETLMVNIRPLLYYSFCKLMWYGLSLIIVYFGGAFVLIMFVAYLLWWVYKE